MTSPYDFSVALHIGAHKTATSHLQRTLLEHGDMLVEQGVRYYGPDYLRLPGRSLAAMFSLYDGRRGRRPKRDPLDQLEVLRKDGHRLVLSEENFVGILQNPWAKKPVASYPQAAERIAALSDALGLDGMDVFLGIRNPTTFLSSAYSQMLLGGRIMQIETYRNRNPVMGVDWVDLSERVRGSNGVKTLTVWRYEDYQDVFGQICAGMVGDGPASRITPLAKRVHPGLSAAAVKDVLRRHQAGERGKLANEARKMLPVDADHPVFDAFTAAEHAEAEAQYQTQTDTIAGMTGVTFLRPTGQ